MTVLAGILGAVVLLTLGPGPAPLGAASGDPELARDAAAALAPGHGCPAVSVARIEDGRASWAGFGDVDVDSRFELGSITKTFDGILLADAAARGEVRLDDRLDARVDELAGTEVGSVTLQELASHRAGLPPLARPEGIEVVAEDLAGAELTAYTADDGSVLAASASIVLTRRGEWAYSNLGAALLGFALVRAADAPDWPTYVHRRLFVPLGMRSTLVAERGRPAPDLMQPHLPNGHPAAAWTGTGYAPAGVGVTTTAADLTRYAQALLDGTAPGMDALDARWPARWGQQIGLAWMIADGGGHPVAWHNGGTSGTRTMLAIDRTRGTAAIVLTNAASDVTATGLQLVGGAQGLPTPPRIDAETAPWVLIGSLAVISFLVSAVRGRSRARILGRGLAVVGALLLWWVAAPWDWAPQWAFVVATGLALTGLVVTAERWTRLPWVPERRPRLALAALVLGATWLLVMLALAARVLVLRP